MPACMHHFCLSLEHMAWNSMEYYADKSDIAHTHLKQQ